MPRLTYPTRAMIQVLAVLMALSSVGGCAQNPLVLQNQLQTLQQQHTAVAKRNDELVSRAEALDRDNQELGTLLAQERQRVTIVQDQVAALQDQLKGATTQLAQTREQHSVSEKKVETLAASAKRRTTATISANRSLTASLPDIDVPGVEVRPDGNVVRIELPGGQLFEPGGARLLPQAPGTIEAVAAEIARLYPQQRIGIEGHTDSDTVAGVSWHNNHQLAIGRAMAVYEQLVARGRLKPAQLFVAGHGANHPVVSNGTPAGKDRNRRVEIVIYPERVSAG